MRSPLILAALVCLLGIDTAAAQSLPWSVIGSGAGAAASAETSVQITLGQPLIGGGVPGTAGADLGFWAGFVNGQALVPVLLDYLTADWEERSILLRWKVSGDSRNHVGFQVYRQAGAGERNAISDRLPAVDGEYRFVDASPLAGDLSYYLSDLHRDGTLSWHGPVTIGAAPLVSRLALAQNLPNPFRQATRFSFQLPTPGHVSLKVFDPSGRTVARLLEDDFQAGVHEIEWNGWDLNARRLSSGIYFYRLETAQGTITRKLVVLP